jgi:hypothetical protein
MSKIDDFINYRIKIFFIILTFFVTIIFSYSPMIINLKRKLKKVLGLMNSLNGGILFGIGLFILLPHADKSFKLYISQPAKSMEEDTHSKWEEMPYAFYISFASYALLLFIEKVAFTKMMNRQNPGNIDDTLSIMSDSVDIHIDSDEEEEVIKDALSTKGRLASFLQNRNSNNK